MGRTIFPSNERVIVALFENSLNEIRSQVDQISSYQQELTSLYDRAEGIDDLKASNIKVNIEMSLNKIMICCDKMQQSIQALVTSAPEIND